MAENMTVMRYALASVALSWWRSRADQVPARTHLPCRRTERYPGQNRTSQWRVVMRSGSRRPKQAE